jgi:hypothetical protein
MAVLVTAEKDKKGYFRIPCFSLYAVLRLGLAPDILAALRTLERPLPLRTKGVSVATSRLVEVGARLLPGLARNC